MPVCGGWWGGDDNGGCDVEVHWVGGVFSLEWVTMVLVRLLGSCVQG